jgi:hypothetical protein
MTTTTGANGVYAFTGVPSLSSGQYYYVRYQNTSFTPGRLWSWATRTATTYATGSAVNIGNFDLADTSPVTPAHGSTIALPYTFRWIPRAAPPTDGYELNFYDPNGGSAYFYTYRGYASSYTLNSLPTGFNPNTQYGWYLRVYGPDSGVGSTYGYYVMFSNSGARINDNLPDQSLPPYHGEELPEQLPQHSEGPPAERPRIEPPQRR